MYMHSITDDQIDEAMVIVEALKTALLGLVLGKTRPGWSCDCGSSHAGPAEAVGVSHPRKGRYPEQMASFISWNVRMRDNCTAPGKYTYSCGLSDFINYEVLSAIFDKHWRTFCQKHFPDVLAEDERRRAPGGDLYGRVEQWA